MDKIKFSLSRKALQKLIVQKMRDNLNDDSYDLITKNFRSYVKSKSASQRIPEFVSYCGVVRRDSEDQVTRGSTLI